MAQVALKRRPGVDRPGLERYIERLGRSFRIKATVLFGSRSRGDELAESDYDLLIVSDGFTGMAVWDRIQTCIDAWELPEPLEVIALTPAELELRRNEIGTVAEALREGIQLLQ